MKCTFFSEDIVLILTIAALFAALSIALTIKEVTDKKRKKKSRANNVVAGPKNNHLEQITKQREFWDKAADYLISFIRARDVDTASEFVLNIWNTRDKKEHGDEIHKLLNFAIEESYLFRNDSNEMFDFIHFLCDLDISNIDNYVKNAPRNSDGLCYMPSLSKKAIMLEKSGRLTEAISVCDIGIEHRVLDPGYRKYGLGSFEYRKEY